MRWNMDVGKQKLSDALNPNQGKCWACKRQPCKFEELENEFDHPDEDETAEQLTDRFEAEFLYYTHEQGYDKEAIAKRDRTKFKEFRYTCWEG